MNQHPVSSTAGNRRRLDTMIATLQFAIDVTILIVAFHAAYILRFDFELPHKELAHENLQLLYVIPLQLAVIRMTGLQLFVWRYIGMADITTFLATAVWSALPMVALRFTLPDYFLAWRVPFSVIIMDAMMAFGGLLAIRVLRRAAYERARRRRRSTDRRARKAVLFIGAGRAGVAAIREIHTLDLEVKGFVDDDPNKQGTLIQGVGVVGTTRELPALARAFDIDHVIISMDKAPRREMKRITDICESIPIKVRIIPGMAELLQGNIKFSGVRDVQIEDLLGREPVKLDDEDVGRLLAERTIMVTGAGGSIGSELARQICRFKPSQLLLVERSEFALFTIDQELLQTWPKLSIRALIADVGDAPRMRAIFAEHRPAVVIHAAAHKHVPMMECNTSEAIKNNVLATRLVAELAGESGVEAFVLISTDKAVRPRSIMGASKRVAELAVQTLNGRFVTRYVAVRFGNVIGSAGSVIPIFKEQIRKGGPVTVTHRDMMRYFMTIPEATQLVLQAAAIGRGGEIFVLDMGEPVRILELAKDLIRLSGLRPGEDIDITFTGLRPGEKLLEELDMGGEQIAKTRHPKIFIGDIAKHAGRTIQAALDQFALLAKAERADEMRQLLSDLLPEADLGVGAASKAEAPPMRVPARESASVFERFAARS